MTKNLVVEGSLGRIIGRYAPNLEENSGPLSLQFQRYATR